MTAQISEKLLFEGERHAMCTNPLGDYCALGGELPNFESNCTALWRGYVGTWEVINERLYLIDLSGELESGEDANLETVFLGMAIESSPIGTLGPSACLKERCLSTFIWDMGVPMSVIFCWSLKRAF